jgi:hypothetical protein
MLSVVLRTPPKQWGRTRSERKGKVEIARETPFVDRHRRKTSGVGVLVGHRRTNAALQFGLEEAVVAEPEGLLSTVL